LRFSRLCEYRPRSFKVLRTPVEHLDNCKDEMYGMWKETVVDYFKVRCQRLPEVKARETLKWDSRSPSGQSKSGPPIYKKCRSPNHWAAMEENLCTNWPVEVDSNTSFSIAGKQTEIWTVYPVYTSLDRCCHSAFLHSNLHGVFCRCLSDSSALWTSPN
jgi:hypothetical protein